MVEDTTLISTPGRGSASASFIGAALWTVRHAVKGLKNILVNKNMTLLP